MTAQLLRLYLKNRAEKGAKSSSKPGGPLSIFTLMAAYEGS
jgi:hypothetical protein